jgi:hypothetical protein|tara:strand:+ start:272 stop:586 length:315 start_codon:yes stop_codon:yes gene_type:complete
MEMSYDTRWVQVPVARDGYYGASADQFLGGLMANTAREFIDDPYVQQTLVEIQEDCKNKAKTGVTEWMQENWHWFVVGGAGLIAANFLMLSVAVLPYLGRKRQP